MKYDPRIVTAYYVSQGLPAPVYELQFHDTRKWRFDLSWPEYGVALEVEGLGGGRHQRTAGFLADIDKYNEAALLRWTVLRTINKELCMLDTVRMVAAALRMRGWDTTERTAQ
jgi:hypothetical protein